MLREFKKQRNTTSPTTGLIWSENNHQNVSRVIVEKDRNRTQTNHSSHTSSSSDNWGIIRGFNNLWELINPMASKAVQFQTSDLTTTVSTTQGSTTAPDERENVQGKPTKPFQDLRVSGNKVKDFKSSSSSTPNYPSGWLTSK